MPCRILINLPQNNKARNEMNAIHNLFKTNNWPHYAVGIGINATFSAVACIVGRIL